MANVATIYVKLGLNAKDYHDGLNKATQSTRGFGSTMGGVMGGLGKVAMLGLGAVVAGAGAATVALASTVKPASDLSESINALSVVFGDAKNTLLDYSKTAAQTVGLSAREFNQLGTVTGAFLQNLGWNASNAADETITLTERAADMASVFNTDVGTALGSIQSLLKGEFNPIEQFGVKMNASSIEAYALANGLAATKDELTDNIKAQAALALLYEQTEKVSGDFQNTSEGLANTQRRLAAMSENLKAKIGTALLPIVEKFANMLVKLLDNPAVKQGLDDFIAGLGLLADRFGRVFDALLSGGFGSLFKTFEDGNSIFTSFLKSLGVGEEKAQAFQQSIGTALSFLSNWWAINGPGIIAAAQQMVQGLVKGFEDIRAKVEPFIQQVLGKLIVWFTENGPLIQDFAQAIANFFTNILVPAVSGAVDLILPLVGSIIDIILGLGKFVMQVVTGDWAGAWESLKTIAMTALDAVWKFILSAVDKILNLFGTSLPESVQIWRNNFEMLGQIADHIRNRISDAIQGVIGWIQKMIDKLSNISLPDWLTPGSPTPFEIGLIGIQKALRGVANQAMPQFGASLQFAGAPDVRQDVRSPFDYQQQSTATIDDSSIERLVRGIVEGVMKGEGRDRS